jgi:hypothetical protein
VKASPHQWCYGTYIYWQDDIENSPVAGNFPFVYQDLHSYVEFAPRVALATQELVRESVNEVLSSLRELLFQNRWLLGPIWETIG